MYARFRDSVYALVLTYWRDRFRRKRVGQFLTLMKPADGISIVDVGGWSGDFLGIVTKGLGGRFVIADIEDQFTLTVKKRYGFEFVRLEEGQPLPFSDKEFDIVVSTSVIEHVTLPKKDCMSRIPQEEWYSLSHSQQRWFANEIRRIGKAYFVQTPHKDFPIESHIWVPFANWLSHNRTISLVHFTNRFWFSGVDYVDWNLLGTTEMKQFFPEACIFVEKFFGLPKAIIACTPREPF